MGIPHPAPLDLRSGQRRVAVRCPAGTHTRRARPAPRSQQQHAPGRVLSTKHGPSLPALWRRRSCGTVLAAAVAEPALAADGKPDPAPQPLAEVAEFQTVPQLWAQLAQRHGDLPAVHDPHQQPQCQASYRQALTIGQTNAALSSCPNPWSPSRPASKASYFRWSRMRLPGTGRLPRKSVLSPASSMACWLHASLRTRSSELFARSSQLTCLFWFPSRLLQASAAAAVSAAHLRIYSTVRFRVVKISLPRICPAYWFT